MAKQTKKTDTAKKNDTKNDAAKAERAKTIVPVVTKALVSIPGVGEIETDVTVYKVHVYDMQVETFGTREQAKARAKELKAEWKAAHPRQTSGGQYMAKQSFGRALYSATTTVSRITKSPAITSDQLARATTALRILSELLGESGFDIAKHNERLSAQAAKRAGKKQAA